MFHASVTLVSTKLRPGVSSPTQASRDAAFHPEAGHDYASRTSGGLNDPGQGSVSSRYARFAVQGLVKGGMGLAAEGAKRTGPNPNTKSRISGKAASSSSSAVLTDLDTLELALQSYPPVGVAWGQPVAVGRSDSSGFQLGRAESQLHPRPWILHLILEAPVFISLTFHPRTGALERIQSWETPLSALSKTPAATAKIGSAGVILGGSQRPAVLFAPWPWTLSSVAAAAQEHPLQGLQKAPLALPKKVADLLAAPPSAKALSAVSGSASLPSPPSFLALNASEALLAAWSRSGTLNILALDPSKPTGEPMRLPKKAGRVEVLTSVAVPGLFDAGWHASNPSQLYVLAMLDMVSVRSAMDKGIPTARSISVSGSPGFSSGREAPSITLIWKAFEYSAAALNPGIAALVSFDGAPLIAKASSAPNESTPAWAIVTDTGSVHVLHPDPTAGLTRVEGSGQRPGLPPLDVLLSQLLSPLLDPQPAPVLLSWYLEQDENAMRPPAASALAWHPSGGLFAVGDSSGVIRFFSSGAQIMEFCANGSAEKRSSLAPLASTSASGTKIVAMSWSEDGGADDVLAVVWERGPIVVIRLDFGAATPGLSAAQTGHVPLSGPSAGVEVALKHGGWRAGLEALLGCLSQPSALARGWRLLMEALLATPLGSAENRAAVPVCAEILLAESTPSRLSGVMRRALVRRTVLRCIASGDLLRGGAVLLGPFGKTESDLWSVLELWARELGLDDMAAAARARIEPSAREDGAGQALARDRDVSAAIHAAGMDLGSVIDTLSNPKSWSGLSMEQGHRVGLYAEARGRFQDAISVYRACGLHDAAARAQEVAQMVHPPPGKSTESGEAQGLYELIPEMQQDN